MSTLLFLIFHAVFLPVLIPLMILSCLGASRPSKKSIAKAVVREMAKEKRERWRRHVVAVKKIDKQIAHLRKAEAGVLGMPARVAELARIREEIFRLSGCPLTAKLGSQ